MFERKIVSSPLPQDLVTPTEHCRPCRGKGWEEPDPDCASLPCIFCGGSGLQTVRVTPKA